MKIWIEKEEVLSLIAFHFNTKTFAIVSLVVFFLHLRVTLNPLQLPFFSFSCFLFFFPVTIFGWTGESFFRMLHSSLPRALVNSIRLVSLNKRRKVCATIPPLVFIWDTCGTRQTMRFSLFTVTSIYIIWNRARNSQKPKNKLEDDRRFTSHRKINWVDKSRSLRKKKKRYSHEETDWYTM